MKRCATFALVLCSLLCAGQETKGPRQVTISFTSPARAGLPIWLTVNTPEPQYLRYPSSEVATDFGCVDVEVRRQGNEMPAFKMPGPMVGAGIVCGTIAGDGPAASYPLHLRYPNLEPGNYQVRYQRYYPDFRTRQKNMIEQSDWTELKVEPATQAQVESWLTDLLAHVPERPSFLVAYFLPSVLASRDDRALDAVLQQAFNKRTAVSYYATTSLSLFDANRVRPRLLRAMHERGPSYELADRLSPIHDIVNPIANNIAMESRRFMESEDPDQVAGAMHTARMVSFFPLDEPTRRALAAAEVKTVERVLATKNERAAQDLVQFLSQLKTPEAHRQLWRFVDARLAEEQALICVTWVKDPADLPKLTEALLQPDAADPQGARRGSVMYGMRGYGPTAQPYYERIVAASKQVFLRAAAAEELVQLNDRTGWQFFRSMMDEKAFYRDEMVRWLKGRYPEISNANDEGMVQFLDSKMRSAQ